MKPIKAGFITKPAASKHVGFLRRIGPTPDRRGKGRKREKKKTRTLASTKIPTDVGEGQLRGVTFCTTEMCTVGTLTACGAAVAVVASLCVKDCFALLVIMIFQVVFCCCAMLLHIDILEEMEKSIAHIISTGKVPGY